MSFDTRSAYSTLLQHALSGIIVQEVRRLLSQAQAQVRGEFFPSSQEAPLRLDFEKDTEKQLENLAAQMVACKRHEKRYWLFRTIAIYALIAASLLIATWIGWVILPWSMAFYGGVLFVISAFLSLAIAGVSLGMLHISKKWLTDTAQEQKTARQEHREMTQEDA